MHNCSLFRAKAAWSALLSILIPAAFATATLTAQADTVETVGGSVIHGKIVDSDGGTIKIKTDFAGVVSIDQSKVKSFTTDEPVNVKLSGGSEVLGTVEKSSSGLVVKGTNGSFAAQPADVKAVWMKGEVSPEVRKLQRKWAYQASVDISGKSGNASRFASDLGFTATLAGPHDTLTFSALYDRAQEDGVKSSDHIKGGVDYSAFFSKKTAWYVREALEKDAIAGIDLRSTAAAGIGRYVIQSSTHTLELRAGLAYRYESYTDGHNVESPGLDFGLNHKLKLGTWGELTNHLEYVPSFNDFSNYRIVHDSGLEFPISSSDFWKLRLGLANEYSSKPPPGRKKLDTTYYTRLLLNWK